MPKQLIVTATPTGEITVEAFGFKGKGCSAASEFLTQALGTVKKVNHKPEYHQAATTLTQQQQHNSAP